MADIRKITELAPILLKLLKFGSEKTKQFIKEGKIRIASDLEKLPQEDLLAIKNIRDQEVLNAQKNKTIIPKKETIDEEDLFEYDVIQDAPDEIKINNQDIVNAANALPSKETMNNPFFGSFYKNKVADINLKNRAEILKKGLEATPETPKVVMPDFKTRYAVSDAKQKYVIDKFKLIKNKNPSAIPQDYPSYRNFMIALEKESDQINAKNLNNLPEITSSIPEFRIVPKTKKQSESEFKATSFEDSYKSRIYSIWQDKIPDIVAGHELMMKRLMDIGDERFLNQVKYPVFFTNKIRNSAHIRLENSLVKLRNRRTELTSGKKLRNRNREKINDINNIIKDINDDMVTLGLETRLYDPTVKKFKIYGKAFSSPKQLYDSIQQKQKLNFLGSSNETYDVLNQVKPKYVSFEGKDVFLPEGYENGGFASIEEVLEYNNG